jgi:hypothetical protein
MAARDVGAGAPAGADQLGPPRARPSVPFLSLAFWTYAVEGHLTTQYPISRPLFRRKVQPFEVVINVAQSMAVDTVEMVVNVMVRIVALPALPRTMNELQLAQVIQLTKGVIDSGPGDIGSRREEALIHLLRRRMTIISHKQLQNRSSLRRDPKSMLP